MAARRTARVEALAEPHVEHAVGFVKRDHADRREVDRAAL
jgi:hypothetical protein